MSHARLIQNWLDQPEDVGHSLHAVGARLLYRDDVQGVRYTRDGQQIVIISTSCDLSLAEFPAEVKVYGVDAREARPMFEFFNRDWMVTHGIRDSRKEIDVVNSALNSELHVPHPPKLVRAARGLRIGREACGLLAFYDSYIPRRFRYAMPKSQIDYPNDFAGSTWSFDNFLILDNIEDAVAIKMASNRAYIIDLYGTGEVEPPPRPIDDVDDGPMF